MEGVLFSRSTNFINKEPTVRTIGNTHAACCESIHYPVTQRQWWEQKPVSSSSPPPLPMRGSSETFIYFAATNSSDSDWKRSPVPAVAGAKPRMKQQAAATGHLRSRLGPCSPSTWPSPIAPRGTLPAHTPARVTARMNDGLILNQKNRG